MLAMTLLTFIHTCIHIHQWSGRASKANVMDKDNGTYAPWNVNLIVIAGVSVNGLRQTHKK
jgi:hypothetical protein